jgi:FkbM family methyltransferase
MHICRLLRIKVIRYHGVMVSTTPEVIPKNVRSALFKGTYEVHELNLIKQILCRNDRVLEIGAGVGVVSLVATSCTGEGQVFSYEGNKTLEATIRANYALNSWCPNLFMEPVTSDGRDICLYCDAKILSTSIYDRGMDFEKSYTQSVGMSELFEKLQPSVLVMDVEGAEAELLALECVKGVREIVVEVHPHIIGEEAVSHLTKSLLSKGFELKNILHKTYHFAQ